MIEVASAAETAEMPATSKPELLERISRYTKSVILIQFFTERISFDCYSSQTVSGTLVSSKIYETVNREYKFNGLSSGTVSRNIELNVFLEGVEWIAINLDSKVSVLVDGSWKVIHDSLPNFKTS